MDVRSAMQMSASSMPKGLVIIIKNVSDLILLAMQTCYLHYYGNSMFISVAIEVNTLQLRENVVGMRIHRIIGQPLLRRLLGIM